jgi:hypothetical protein
MLRIMKYLFIQNAGNNIKCDSIPFFLLLEGLCHEINNFFEGPKSQISTLCICANGFQFCAL